MLLKTTISVLHLFSYLYPILLTYYLCYCYTIIANRPTSTPRGSTGCRMSRSSTGLLAVQGTVVGAEEAVGKTEVVGTKSNKISKSIETTQTQGKKYSPNTLNN